jgi:hypothetical protein
VNKPDEGGHRKIVSDMLAYFTSAAHCLDDNPEKMMSEDETWSIGILIPNVPKNRYHGGPNATIKSRQVQVSALAGEGCPNELRNSDRWAKMYRRFGGLCCAQLQVSVM